MAVYKVAQDVEAEDKLIGPFSFRQFVYVIIAVMGIGLAWALWQLFPLLVVVPLPIIVFFGALALPLRKDQPMETYLAALISFYLKPRRRLWQPDGVIQTIEVTAPKTEDIQRTKNLSHGEAERRLSYLAALADSRGWSIRNTTLPDEGNASMVSDVYNEAQQTQDMLDDSGDVAQLFESMIDKADTKRREEAVVRMQQPTPAKSSSQAAPPAPMPDAAAPPAAQTAAAAPPTTAPADDPAVPIQFNPYPSMRQSVIQPVAPQGAAQQTPATATQPQPAPEPTAQDESSSTSVIQPSPDIINLANNADLSIETIAHEANRLTKKAQKDDEVFISLR